MTQVAELIGADSKEIVFTSGATESNNISVKGVERFYAGKKKHIITTQTEHKSGLVDLELLESSIRPDTGLVSVMTVNNEIGVIQPVADIGRLCRAKKVFFHTDAAQAVGKIPLDVNSMNIDLISISGHKID